MLRFFTILTIVFWSFPAAAYAQIDSLKLALSNSSDGQKVKILNQLSELYRNTNTERAHSYAKQALEASQELESPVLLAQSHINVGIIYRTIGQTQEALQHFTQALSFAESSKSMALKADAFHKIGVTYLLVNEFEPALAYTEKEMELWKRTSDKKGLANALNLSGLIYLNLKDYDKAADYLNQSLALSTEIGDEEQIYKPLVNLGDMYLQLKEPEKAKEFIKRSRKISEKTGNKFGIAIAQLKLGTAYQQMGNLTEAELSTREGLKTSEELNSLSLVRNSYQALAMIYEKQENFRSALQYNRLYIATEDSMLNEMTKRKIAELELKYDIEQKDMEIQRLSEEAKYNRFTVAYIGSMLILVVVLSLVIYNRSQLKTGIRERLKDREQVILDKDRALENTQTALNIVDTYTKKMESMLLPADGLNLNAFPQHFLLQISAHKQSMDFVSTFYKQDISYVVMGDCHGEFEGNAMKKIMTASILHEIMTGNHMPTPAEILTQLNRQLSGLTSQEQELMLDTTVEMAILSYHQGTRRLVYAGANIDLYCLNRQGLQSISGDKAPLGGSKYAAKRKFQNKATTLNPKDVLYLFTKGVQLQKDESGNHTFPEKEWRNLLVSVANEPLDKQKKLLLHALDDWRKDKPYTRDITGIGLAIG